MRMGNQFTTGDGATEKNKGLSPWLRAFVVDSVRNFIIRKAASCVKPASAARSARITIFWNRLEGSIVSSRRTAFGSMHS